MLTGVHASPGLFNHQHITVLRFSTYARDPASLRRKEYCECLRFTEKSVQCTDVTKTAVTTPHHLNTEPRERVVGRGREGKIDVERESARA